MNNDTSTYMGDVLGVRVYREGNGPNWYLASDLRKLLHKPYLKMRGPYERYVVHAGRYKRNALQMVTAQEVMRIVMLHDRERPNALWREAIEEMEGSNGAQI